MCRWVTKPPSSADRPLGFHHRSPWIQQSRLGRLVNFEDTPDSPQIHRHHITIYDFCFKMHLDLVPPILSGASGNELSPSGTISDSLSRITLIHSHHLHIFFQCILPCLYWFSNSPSAIFLQDATLSQGGPRDAAVNFGTHMKFTAASHSFCCDSNAFELNNSKVMAK